MAEICRCPWAKTPLLAEYHDQEWGVPVHDDRKHFEFLVLDALQAGLSWEIILKKRGNYRAALAGFDPQAVAGFGPAELERLVTDPGLIRNRAKSQALVTNAQAFLRIQEEVGSFDAYVWSFVGGRTIPNAWTALTQIPAQTKESQVLSKDLIRRGFKFVGPTIVYAMMHAAGLVNDHLVDCFRYGELTRG
jgi:DNA-3-methyladenine glycosylase I